MIELLKVLFCCFGPAILYQIGKSIRECLKEREEPYESKMMEKKKYEHL